MLSFLRTGFFKDLLIWFIISVILASLVAAGVGLVTDRYFSATVDGLIGDHGEYDLLFQVRTDLKETAVARLQEIIKNMFPVYRKSGCQCRRKTAVFVGLAPQHRTKAVYTNLNNYFRDIPGAGGFSLMTEPRLTLSAIPSGVADLFIREAERISGVRFAFRDGSSIAVILEKSTKMKAVKAALEELLASYRLLEIGFPAGYQVDNPLEVGRNLTELLAGKAGVTLIRNVTSGKSSDDQEALLLTMAEMKRFLLSYAGQVKVIPAQGVTLKPGDLLVLFDEVEHSLAAGEKVGAQDVIVKITAEEEDGALPGLIIQGDSAALTTASARLLGADQKPGRSWAPSSSTVPNSSWRKHWTKPLVSQPVQLVSGSAAQARQVITAAETIQAALNSINGLGADWGGSGEDPADRRFTEGTGHELQNMAII